MSSWNKPARASAMSVNLAKCFNFTLHQDIGYIDTPSGLADSIIHGLQVPLASFPGPVLTACHMGAGNEASGTVCSYKVRRGYSDGGVIPIIGCLC